MPTHVQAFVVTTWLLAMLPGAGQALILRQTLTQGRRHAWTSIAGTASGIVVWSTLAAAGLSAVLLANPSAYLVVRVAGGLVLGYLGFSSLRAMRRQAQVAPAAPSEAPVETESPTRRGAYLAGLATNLGNPKAGVFAVSIIPQFISPGGHFFASGVLLGLIWSTTTMGWYAVFVWVVERGRSVVSRPRVTTWLHGITGAVLMMLGAAVVVGI